jgi:DNA-binding CsgD family transcriptional regulator
MLAEFLTTTLPDNLRRSRELLRAGQVTVALHALTDLPEEGDDDPLPAALRLATTLECQLARGDMSGAGRTGEQLHPHSVRPGVVGALTCHALGELASARGDAEAAATRYADAGDRTPDDLDHPDLVPWRAGRALTLTWLRRHHEAHEVATEHLTLARRTGSAYAVAQALRTVAATTIGDGRIPLLREARGALDGVHAERLAAQIDTDLAVLLTLQGDPDARDEAVPLLRSAEGYAGREDLFPLQNRVRHLLERLGQQPRRIRSETLAKLTASEQRAARMAASGLTNREIAAEMTVTVKAVEWHLSHVYRKLGIPNRTRLADTLGEAV